MCDVLKIARNLWTAIRHPAVKQPCLETVRAGDEVRCRHSGSPVLVLEVGDYHIRAKYANGSVVTRSKAGFLKGHTAPK